MLQRDQAPDVALAIIEYNLERYPADQQTFVTLAQMYQRMGDREALITTLERGIEAMPDNQFFKQMLERVRGDWALGFERWALGFGL